MSAIRNPVSIPAPQIPEYLNGKLTIAANFEITPREAQLFSHALTAISEKLEENGLTKDDLTNVNAVFTADGSFEFGNEESVPALGLHFSLAVYAMERIRLDVVRASTEYVFLIVFLEELVHHYWRIEDEVETKVIVIDVLNKIVDEVYEVTDFFPPDWLNEELNRQGKPARF